MATHPDLNKAECASRAEEETTQVADLGQLMSQASDSFPVDVRDYFALRSAWASSRDALVKDWGVGYLAPEIEVPSAFEEVRGRIVFPLRNMAGSLLGYAGRDPEFEKKQNRWQNLPPEDQELGRPPKKWTYGPSGVAAIPHFFGAERLMQPYVQKQINKAGGLIVVEGPGDVIRLARAKLCAVALMGAGASNAQVHSLVEMALSYADSRLLLLLDLDDRGRRAMAQMLVEQLCLKTYARIGWPPEVLQHCVKKPQELGAQELGILQEHIWNTAPPRRNGVG